jgi:hypothetical protein
MTRLGRGRHPYNVVLVVMREAALHNANLRDFGRNGWLYEVLLILFYQVLNFDSNSKSPVWKSP